MLIKRIIHEIHFFFSLTPLKYFLLPILDDLTNNEIKPSVCYSSCIDFSFSLTLQFDYKWPYEGGTEVSLYYICFWQLLTFWKTTFCFNLVTQNFCSFSKMGVAFWCQMTTFNCKHFFVYLIFFFIKFFIFYNRDRF